MNSDRLWHVLLIVLGLFIPSFAHASCGTTDITWKGATSTSWNVTSNWTPATVPSSSTQNAIIVSATRVPTINYTTSIGCLEVNSGQLKCTNKTLTITGDYFKAVNTNSLNFSTSYPSCVINLAGTQAQEFDVVDPINQLTLSGNNTVTLNDPFTIRNALNLTGTSTVLNINGNLTIASTASALTIPAGVTVYVNSGVTLTSNVNITVSGTLIVNNGASLVMANGTSLTVNSGGVFQLAGSNGNVATLTSTGSGSTYAVNIAGTMSANYFRLDRLNSSGLNLTGTLQSMSNGEFHYLAASGYAITLGSAAVVPSTMDTIGFFNDDNNASVKNINATSYNLTSVTISNWSGGVGGAANSTDPNGKITWGAQAGTLLTLSNDTATGSPPTTIAPSSADTLFGTFAFALNQASAATNITQVTLTMTGTAATSDINVVKVYMDSAGGTNCVYDAGIDAQIGGNLTLTGSPPQVTVSIPSGDVATSSDTTPACIHVLASTSASAQNGNTIQFSVSNSTDVTNSQNYGFSSSSGPPVSAGTSTISGTTALHWKGTTDQRWNRAANWQGSAVPSSTRDCYVGSGTNVPQVNVNASCQNATFETGGTLDFKSTNTEFAAYGSLTVQSGFTFTNASAGVMAMRGAANQSLSLATPFPGPFIIANTGTLPTNVVTVSANSTIQNTLTVNSGVLQIPSGVNLTVLGNITVASGAELDVLTGGELDLGNNAVLTIANGGKLKLLGASGSPATISSDAAADSFSIVVQGTIQAQYYSISNLNSSGMVVQSTATIDSTNHLQNGTFSYPVQNNTTFLTLQIAVPTNSLDSMAFTAAGSSATGTKSVNTASVTGSGTLSMTNYSGNLSGIGTDVSGSYAVSWSGATNTIDITNPISGPTTVSSGGTYTMGDFGFTQSQAGASFSNTDITSLKLTLNGTGAAGDVSQVRIYYDSACTGTGGTQIGSGTLSGSPASVTFSIAAGAATVDASTTSPPTACIYVSADVSNSATNGDTIGFQISQASDVVDSQSYAVSGTTAMPVTLGTPATIQATSTTIWTGATSTDWFTATNWSAGIPTSSKDCQINNASRNPVISGSQVAVCDHLTNGNGTITMTSGVGAQLQIYGNFSNSGTFVQNDGTIQFVDTAGIAQTVSSSSSLTSLSFNKTAGGSVVVSGTLTLASLSLPATANFDFRVNSGVTLILNSGLTVAGGTFTVDNGGTVEMGSGAAISVTGGTFRTTGVNDYYPQSLTDKGTVTSSGSGTWSFTASGGTVSLTGFILSNINTSGLVINSGATLAALDGGQFQNLSTSYSSVTGIQLNTSNLPATATNVGWNWGPNNTPPSPSTAYTLISSTGCGGNTISFDYWFGDWSINETTPDPNTKISATNCTVTMGYSGSPAVLDTFTVQPYNSAAVVTWSTDYEWNHLGFNLYRADSLTNSYVKLNPQLIAGGRGSPERGDSYSWIDTNLTNGLTYYYLLESVDPGNAGYQRFGPITTVPLASLTAPPQTVSPSPAPAPSPSPGPLVNSSAVDYGGGIQVLAQTPSSIRVVISPATPTYAPSPWNSSYEVVSDAGYSNTMTAGQAQLLERVVLVPLNQAVSQISTNQISLTESSDSPNVIAPAPAWTNLGNGVLQPSWSPDPAWYGQNQDMPSNYYSVESTPEVVNGQYYAKITVDPLKYNPAQGLTRNLTQAVFDINLTGTPWQAPQQPVSAGQSTATPTNVLRMKLSRSGLYQLNYSDLVSLGLNGPFAGVDVNQLQLYYHGSQIPMEVDSASGQFGPGDSIRFYATVQTSLQDNMDEVDLSPFPLLAPESALRIQTADADPTSFPDSAFNQNIETVFAEQNLYAVWDYPLGMYTDHFFWLRLISPPAPWASFPQKGKVTVTLPNLTSGNYNVTLKVRTLAGDTFNTGVEHHIGLWINSVPYRVADQTFFGEVPTDLTFSLPSTFFVAGDNDIYIEDISDFVPLGDYQVVDLDNIQVQYQTALSTSTDTMELWTRYTAQNTTVSGFSTPNVLVYDVSDPSNVMKLQNFTVQAAGSGYSARFAVRPDISDSYGYHMIALEQNQFLSPDQLFLNYGFPSSLMDTSNQADMLIIAPSHLVESAELLADYRRSQGLHVKVVSLEQIYAEFSFGDKSVEAVRDFVQYTRTNWQSPQPEYLLFIGKGTYDPIGNLNYGTNSTYMAVPIQHGVYEDYGDTNWFATNGQTVDEQMAVGRIPADDSYQLEQYIQKIKNYEAGFSAPDSSHSHSFTFFGDQDTMNERFPQRIQQMQTEILQLNSNSAVQSLLRQNFTDNQSMGQSIAQAFNDSPFMITYLGHGATYFWADSGIFNQTQAAALTNSRLPFVMSLACMTADFSEPDPNTLSIGENLVMNPSGGAIAYWGTPAVTVPDAQQALGQALFTQINAETNQTYHVARMGDLILRAKKSVQAGTLTADAINSYTLLGDPALELPANMFKPSAGASSGGGGGCGRVIEAAASGPKPPTWPGFFIAILPLICLVVLRVTASRLSRSNGSR